MALKNQPEFEVQDNSNSAATATKEEPAATKEKLKPEVTGTAVAPAQNTAVGAAKKLVVAFADAKDVFDTPTVSALSRATPRITAEQGALCKNRTIDMGKVIHLEIVSWNHRWAVGCGEDKMTDEMKAAFRVSFDNKTIDGEDGRTIADYIEFLKAEGYDKARSTPYADIFGYITHANGKDIPVEDRELVLVQASQTSLGNFTAFCVSRGLLVSRGLVQPSDIVEITAIAQQSGSNKYTNMAFAAVKTAPAK